MNGMMGRSSGEIVEEFQHQLGAQRENFQHKLDLVVEGQQMLAESLDCAKGVLVRLVNV